MNKNFSKGVKMALPFIAGLAIGTGAVIAFNKREILKQKFANSLEKSKDIANNVKEFTQEKAENIKEFVAKKPKQCEVLQESKTTSKKSGKKDV